MIRYIRRETADDEHHGRHASLQHIVKALERRYPQVRLVQHEVNQGYGAAVFTGLTSAKKELVFFTDADRQFDLREIEKLLALIGEADLVVGYRAPRRDPFMRRLNGWGWSWLVTVLFGYTARDIDCAFKLMRRTVVCTYWDANCERFGLAAESIAVRALESVIGERLVPTVRTCP